MTIRNLYGTYVFLCDAPFRDAFASLSALGWDMVGWITPLLSSPISPDGDSLVHIMLFYNLLENEVDPRERSTSFMNLCEPVANQVRYVVWRDRLENSNPNLDDVLDSCSPLVASRVSVLWRGFSDFVAEEEGVSKSRYEHSGLFLIFLYDDINRYYICLRRDIICAQC